MLTVFTIPKAFAGKVGEIQRRAIVSWLELAPGVQVVLVGDEPGVVEAAAELGVEHVAGIRRSDQGTPRIDDAFNRVETSAQFGTWCFVNADIVLGPEILVALEHVERAERPFLLVGQTRDLDPSLVVDDPFLRRCAALEHGTLRGVSALDWFLFPSGLFDPIPAFLVGRAGYDNWLVWRGRQRGIVVDTTAVVVAIHQTHGYQHVEGGKDTAYYGPEAEHNIELAGGRSHIFTLHDASHRLGADFVLRRNPGAVLRVAETVRKVKWKLRTH